MYRNLFLQRRIVLALAGVVTLMNPQQAQSRGDAVRAAQGVLQRTLGPKAAAFELKEVPRENGLDVFVVSAKDGKVSVAGSSGVAISRGAYEYIRRACRGLVTWEGSRLPLPDKLPDFAELRVACPHRYRHYFNVCTFGYTMTWWDWNRWEREIDWMALHGINMPLAMTGTEYIWQLVWRDLGVTDQELDAYFTGPAFLPWHRMGNINRHLGPLSHQWQEAQRDLQKKILARERELGMTPVVPGFSGFVPPGYARAHPDARIRKSTAWAGFESTLLLDARDPMFVEIGRKYIETYRREFGSDHLYLADSFNEMPPQTDPQHKLDDLKAAGEAVFKAITAGDPDGVWVMQGWLFFNERSYWGAEEVKALLSAVPNDRMILLDLACDLMPVWKLHAPFREKQWICCTLHNFGQATPLFGDLQDFGTRPVATLHDAGRGNLIGMGITMEGIEQNAILYELLTDMMWREQPVDVDGWIGEYLACRYGDYPREMKAAWQLMRHCVYTAGGLPQFGSALSANYYRRPRIETGGEVGPHIGDLRRIVGLYLDCADRFGGNPLYQRDLVDIEKRFLEECAMGILHRVMTAYDTRDEKTLAVEARRYLELLADLDRLLDSQPPHRLSEWIRAARQWGPDAAAQDYYERNARTQVTIWGGPMLYDYAAKEWSGLTADFYAERWRRFFDELKRTVKAQDFDLAAWDKSIAAWEAKWTQRTDLPKSSPANDTVGLARALFKKYEKMAEEAPPPRGIAVGKPVTVSGGTERGHGPEFAVDGSAANRDFGWYASPYPQWLQIDLEQPADIGAATVYPYWDGQRHYQYTVELSMDGKEWTPAVDMSKNTRPATARGHAHTFTATKARYVRVNLLHNSANLGVHLIEVRVFAAK